MKKSIWLTVTFGALILGYSLLNAQDKVQAGKSAHMIIRYNDASNLITVIYGGDTQAELVKCKSYSTSDCVIDLLTRFRADGYELTSTTSNIVKYSGGSPGASEIYLFLTRAK